MNIPNYSPYSVSELKSALEEMKNRQVIYNTKGGAYDTILIAGIMSSLKASDPKAVLEDVVSKSSESLDISPKEAWAFIAEFTGLLFQ